MSLDCTRNRQIASLLPPAFRDLPFPISLLTDSLIYIIYSGRGRGLAERRKAGVLRHFELITAEEKINSAFEAIQTHIKIIGLPPEKRGQVIKSFSSEKNVFTVTEENKNIIQ